MPILRLALLSLLLLSVFATSAHAASLVGDYTFENETLNSSVGGPALVNVDGGNSFATETVNGVSEKVLVFPKGGGLHLPVGGVKANEDYSVVFNYRFAEVTGVRRLMAYKNYAGNDIGLYTGSDAGSSTDGQLTFWDGNSFGFGRSDTKQTPGVYQEIAMARQENANTGIPRAHFYKDGQHEFSFSDTTNTTVFTAEGLYFFTDDTDEESAGAVARIRVYKGRLSDAEILAIKNGTGGPGPADTDADTVYDHVDNCPSVANAGQQDADADGIGDACDTAAAPPDGDGDGVPDSSDNCPAAANAGQQDADADKIGDACDTSPNPPPTDSDGDGLDDAGDNCPTVPSAGAGSLDPDVDGQGNACDGDDDNDGHPDTADNCPVDANADQTDTDADKTGDACDPDDDNDGVLDGIDICPILTRAGATGCPPPELVKASEAKAVAAGKGIKVKTGFKAPCKLSTIECTLNALVSTNASGPSIAKVIKLGTLKTKIKPGKTKVVVVKLTKKGAALLRKAKNLRVTIKITLRGPDGQTVTVKRKAKLKAPA